MITRRCKVVLYLMTALASGALALATAGSAHAATHEVDYPKIWTGTNWAFGSCQIGPERWGFSFSFKFGAVTHSQATLQSFTVQNVWGTGLYGSMSINDNYGHNFHINSLHTSGVVTSKTYAVNRTFRFPFGGGVLSSHNGGCADSHDVLFSPLF